MNQSFSDDCDSPEKFPQQVNIKDLLSEAKPVISQSKQLAKQLPFKQTLAHHNVIINQCRTGLFKRDGSIKLYPFASNFESGNLESVESRVAGVYILRLRQDTNSQHKSGWFYFQVRGIKTGTFKIKGFPKPKLLYENGMKICFKENGKWIRGGNHISYQPDQSEEYTLSFHYTFDNPSQVSEVAYCFPYTYSNNKQYLRTFCRKHPKNLSRQNIARTILGNDVQVLVFSAGISKPIIIVSARVHPSQSVASWICQGFLEWLVTTAEGQLLLEHFQVRVIPMINPDGVVRGNHRFSFAGTDLNRKWKKCHQKLHPQIFFIKNYIQDIDPKRIRMQIDLHGHSRKKGVFFYGCEDSKSPDSSARSFPYLLSKISPYFQYSKCCFKVQSSKEGTARIYLWKLLKIPYVYTLECSLCGLQGEKRNFEISDLLKIGADLGIGIQIFFSMMIKGVQSQKLALRSKILTQFEAEKQILNTQEGSAGSQSEPSEGDVGEHEVMKAIERFKQSKSISKYKINSQTPETGLSKGRASSFVLANQRQTGGIVRKNFRKRVSTSYQVTRSDRKKVGVSVASRLDQSQFLLFEAKDDINSLTPLQNIFQSESQGWRPETRESRIQYLNQILGSSEQNLNDLEFQGGRPYHQSGKLFLPEEFMRADDLESKQRTVPSETFRPGFYGAQYVRVKKYAEKIMMEKQRKQQNCIENVKVVQRTSGAFRPSGQLKLQVISLQRRLKQQTPLLMQKPPPTRRSSTTNR